jgi:hypothetical protein
MKSLTKTAVISISVLIFWGCPSAPPKSEKEISSKPEIVLQIASLNLSNLNKRIERKNITEIAGLLKREQIEILAVQGISRYPGVATRIDFVNELASQTDWRNVFGEMLNISGRQTGNAVFSAYPIISHHNQQFEKVKSDNFESALQATVDAGVRSLVVVSTQLPPKASIAEQTLCIKTIAVLNPDTKNPMTIIAGNLPASETIRTANAFADITPAEAGKNSNSKMWYSANTSFRLLNSHTVETELGVVLIAQIGLFK